MDDDVPEDPFIEIGAGRMHPEGAPGIMRNMMGDAMFEQQKAQAEIHAERNGVMFEIERDIRAHRRTASAAGAYLATIISVLATPLLVLLAIWLFILLIAAL